MIKINKAAVWARVCRILPVKVKNFICEKLANLLPRRVVGWVLYRACVDYGCNKHITLIAACKKYKNYEQGSRGVTK